MESTIAAQLAFASVLLVVGVFCLWAPHVVQRIAMRYCPGFVRSYVEADFYRIHVRICGCMALLMAGLVVYATFWASTGD